AMIGILIELCVYRFLRRAGSSSLILFLSSLAVVIIIQNAIGMIFGSEIQVAQRQVEQGDLQIIGVKFTSLQAIASVVTIFIFSITWAFLRFTLTGKKMRAIANDPDLAEIIGIRRDRILLVAIAIGSSLAGIAGFLICYDTAVNPTSGFGVLLIGITAAIVGGIDNIPGTMLGGI